MQKFAARIPADVQYTIAHVHALVNIKPTASIITDNLQKSIELVPDLPTWSAMYNPTSRSSGGMHSEYVRQVVTVVALMIVKTLGK